MNQRFTARRPACLLLLIGLTLSAGTGCHLCATGHNMQGVRHYQNGQFDMAVQRFQKAVTVNPNDADAQYNIAATLHRMGIAKNDPQVLGQAEALYNRCLDLDPDHVECHRGLAVLLVETDRADRAFALLQNWARDTRKKSDANIELARLYEEFGDVNSAIDHLEDATGFDHQNSRAFAALGSLREKSGNYAQALENYKRSYGLNQMQPKMAERIAALSRQLQHESTLSGGGTRMVDAGGNPATPGATPRY